MRLGIFGGTFDPVHKAHAAVAVEAVKKGRLHQLLVMPSFFTPGKSQAVASARDRMRMLEIVFEGMDDIKVCDEEINRGGTSFTIDTVRWARVKWPDDELWVTAGSDAVAMLETWKEWDNLVSLAGFIIYPRGHEPIPHHVISRLQKVIFLDSPVMEDCSTIIRTDVHSSLARDFLHPLVYDYIVARELYHRQEPNTGMVNQPRAAKPL